MGLGASSLLCGISCDLEVYGYTMHQATILRLQPLRRTRVPTEKNVEMAPPTEAWGPSGGDSNSKTPRWVRALYQHAHTPLGRFTREFERLSGFTSTNVQHRTFGSALFPSHVPFRCPRWSSAGFLDDRHMASGRVERLTKQWVNRFGCTVFTLWVVRKNLEPRHEPWDPTRLRVS